MLDKNVNMSKQSKCDDPISPQEMWDDDVTLSDKKEGDDQISPQKSFSDDKYNPCDGRTGDDRLLS